MSVTVEEVMKVSHLARIKMDNESAENFKESLNKILHFVERLDEVDCSKIDDGVQYATTLHEREDVALPCNPAVMDNACEKECNMFVVPKMIG